MATVYVRAQVGVLQGAFFTQHPVVTQNLPAEDAQAWFEQAARSAQAEDLGVLLTLQAACAQAPELPVHLSVHALH